jgi:hypothetical protein
MRYFLFYAFFLFGCGKSDPSLLQYRDGRQLLTLNETDETGHRISRPKVRMIAPDSIVVGEVYSTRIFLTDTDEDFIVAFTDCNMVDTLSIDTTTFQIGGVCRSKLFAQDDTVFVAFRPQSPGINTFQTIKIVTRDKYRIFRTIDYSFDYKVVDN